MRVVASSLPRRSRASPLATPVEVPAAAAQPRTRILVVDDDGRNLLALSEVLQDIADVACANSGEEALRFLLKEQFAVIILDVLMPGLDGYETAALVRQREQSRDTPIIFLTAINKEDAHLLRGYDSGAVDYVFKPFEPTILRSKVKVFVSLYEKTREIERKAISEQVLLEENLRAHWEKLRAVEALREAEERQALILKSLPLAVYVDESRQSGRSPRFVAGDVLGVTGYDAEAFDKDPELWISRVHPDDRDVAQFHPRKFGAEHHCEYRWQHVDGSYRYLVDQMVVVPDRENLVAGTLLDITERRHLQDQLLQAQKLDAIGKLTGGIAHDFNNLLASVLGGLVLIERRVEMNDKARQVFEMTRNAAQKGSHLVNRMLAFSRRQNLTPEVVRVGVVSQSLGAMLNPLLGGMIRLEWEIEDELWPAFVDPSQLELAIMNLVFNARDAMPSGGTITIRMANRTRAGKSQETEAGDYIVVTVVDTGSGIPPELLHKVVEPFFTTKDVGKGTGLGLSTAYGFAKQSGGTLLIESTVGRGTSVEIWLPRSRIAVPESAGSEIGAEPEGLAPSTRLGSILLVDDSASLRELTAMELVDAGYGVVCAAGGAEALAMIERDPDRFDLIVTDYAMPLMSGLEVIRFARSMRSNWPAVIITGYADYQEMGNRPADVPVVTKPFTLGRLLEAIGSVAGVGAQSS